MTPGEIKSLMAALKADADNLIGVSDDAAKRFVIAIQRAEARLFEKMATFMTNFLSGQVPNKPQKGVVPPELKGNQPGVSE